LWPAYGDAASRGDIDWIERTLSRSLLAAAAVATALSLALLALSRTLIDVWIGGAVAVSGSLLIVLALWKPLEGAGMAVAIFLNGAGIIRFQIVTACLMAAGTLLLKPWLVALWGPAGAPAVTALLFTCLNLVPMAFYIPGVLRNMRAIRSR
jgi:O-antigen/teichoic acid export membrane protein